MHSIRILSSRFKVFFLKKLWYTAFLWPTYHPACRRFCAISCCLQRTLSGLKSIRSMPRSFTTDWTSRIFASFTRGILATAFHSWFLSLLAHSDMSKNALSIPPFPMFAGNLKIRSCLWSLLAKGGLLLDLWHMKLEPFGKFTGFFWFPDSRVAVWTFELNELSIAEWLSEGDSGFVFFVSWQERMQCTGFLSPQRQFHINSQVLLQSADHPWWLNLRPRAVFFQGELYVWKRDLTPD